MKRTWLGHALALGMSLSLISAAAEAGPKRTILHHGKVFTADESKPWAQAVAIKGDTIVAVGNNAEVLALASPSTELIDLGGRAVIPGLNDAHVHVLGDPGVYLNTPDFIPGPGPTTDDVLDLIEQGTSAYPPGTWLVLLVGSNVLEDPSMDRLLLDTVSPDHPVKLESWTGHGTFVNTTALDELGIALDEPDPFGGSFERYPNTNVITGEAHEYAEFLIRRRRFAAIGDAALIGAYQGFSSAMIHFGVTSLQDMPVGLPHTRAVDLMESADLPLRIRSICFPLSPLEPCLGAPEAPPNAWVTGTGVKWISDGTPVERAAFVNDSYQDKPNAKGTLNFSQGALDVLLLRSRIGQPGRRQPLVHAVGDGAVDAVLDGLEQTGGPGAWAHRRPRIEHGDLLFPYNFDRARDLGVVIVQNPTHFALAGVFAQRFSPDVLADLEPLQSLLDAGVHVALGSDAIGAPRTPWLDIFFAMIHPTRPTEALSLEQAITAYTRGSAYAEHMEHKKGSIKAGSLADIAVLNQDVFVLPPPALLGTQSELTMVGGKIVWKAF